VVATSLAEVTSTARNTRLHSHPISRLEVLDKRSYLGDDSGRLMPQDHGPSENIVSNSATLPVVNITATDACLGDMN
jgi:hypothetical protein